MVPMRRMPESGSREKAACETDQVFDLLMILRARLLNWRSSLRTCYFGSGAALSNRYDYAPYSLVLVDCHRHLGARLESRGDHVGKGNDHESLGHNHIPS